MPMIVSNKQRIHFALEGEHGPYLLLHHGLFGSHRDWYEWGFVKVLSRDYRLVIPDARGHGRSDKPLAADQYALSQFGDDVMEVLDRLDVRTINFIGYSLGALIGFDLLSRFSGRVRGAVLGGEAPVVGAPMLKEWEELADRLETESLSAVLQALREEKRLACSIIQFPEDPINQSAPIMLRAMGSWKRNEAEKIQLRSPLALFRGKAEHTGERIAQAGKRILHTRMISLDEDTSAEAMTAPENLLKELLDFLGGSRPLPEGEGRSDARRKSEDGGRRGGRPPKTAAAESAAKAESSPQRETEGVAEGGAQAGEEQRGQEDSELPNQPSRDESDSQAVEDLEAGGHSRTDQAGSAGLPDNVRGQHEENASAEGDVEPMAAGESEGDPNNEGQDSTEDSDGDKKRESAAEGKADE